MPFLRTGRALRTAGLLFARAEKKTHQMETNMNCTTVRVTGFGSAVKMALEEVFVRIEVPYQKTQSNLWEH
jgi:hypothetical protein